MIRPSAVALTLALLAPSAFAGDNGGGTLACTSATGRTKLEGGAGINNYNGSGNVDLLFTIDGKSLRLSSASPVHNPRGNNILFTEASVFSDKDRVYVLQLGLAEKSVSGEAFQFQSPILTGIANPQSMRKLNGDKFSFDLVIQTGAIDPRKTNSLSADGEVAFDKPIALKCELDLSI
jgi:hypothetical protein